MSRTSEATADTDRIDTQPPLSALLTVSSSSGYSTADEVATTARPPPKTAKRKTRTPPAPGTQLKRIRVEAAAEAPAVRTTVVSAKPPLPPLARSQKRNAAAVAGKPSGATKHGGEQTGVVNKLTAYADQCRAEIGELKVALANEKAAVRALR